MKVNLIFPEPKDNIEVFDRKSIISNAVRRYLGWGKTNFTPPLSLLMLAAVTPKEIKVDITDERLEAIDFDERHDLVGITCVTRSALRAYEIADEYRKRGVKVVLGGIHPSALPNEAISHADSIVIGEGERAWQQLLHDFKQDKLKAYYKGEPLENLDELPLPKREILKYPDMYSTMKVLTATRGCPNSCAYCSAGVGLYKKYRKRSIESVVNELKQLAGKVLLFFDDNLGWDVNYTKELLRAITPLGVKWFGEISLNALEDPEVIPLAAKSGCIVLGIGFESLSQEVIYSVRKNRTNSPEKYAALIRRLHDAGIAIMGLFIVGFDGDDSTTFSTLIDFFNVTHIEIPSINTLVPYPGSAIYKQYEKEGRLLHKNWSFYDTAGGACVFVPHKMTPTELMDGYLRMIREIYATESILGRLIGAGTWLASGVIPAIHLNLQRRKSIPSQTKHIADYKKNLYI